MYCCYLQTVSNCFGLGYCLTRSVMNIRERVGKDVVVFFCLVMQIIAAGAEIERAAEIRSQPELLAQLPGMFFIQILGDKSDRAAQLRIAISGTAHRKVHLCMEFNGVPRGTPGSARIPEM